MSRPIRDFTNGSAEMLDVFGDAAVVRHGLAFEAALAQAQAVEGLLSQAEAAQIVAVCAQLSPDTGRLAVEAAHAGTLAIPLIAHLRAKLDDMEVQRKVHLGATSQDVADTVLMLQAREGRDLIVRECRRLQSALALLAARTAAMPALGRTLMQSAMPITFGLKAANWLAGIDGARARFEREADRAVKLQFGGAVGTRAGLNGKGHAIAHRMAAILGFAFDPLPWHARRGDIAGVASALAILIGAAAKIARDVALLSQNEIGEVFEPQVAGRGGSSAMAHKRNPVNCLLVLSAAIRAPGLAAAMIAGLPQEQERGLGGWQAEAPVLADLFILCHGAMKAMAITIEGLELDNARMAANLAAAGVGVDTGDAEALVTAMLAARKENS